MKKYLLVALLLIAQGTHADEETSSSNILGAVAEVAFLSFMDAKVTGSCLMQVDAQNRRTVVNKTACKETIMEFESAADSSALGRKVMSAVYQYRAEYRVH